MVKRFVAAVSLVILAIPAQAQNWAYAGPEWLSEFPDDLPLAQFCATSGWTPANSGALALARQWTPLTFESSREMEQAAAAGQCDITAFATSTPGDTDGLIASLGLADVTDLVLSSAAGASDTGLPENAEAILTRIEGDCAGHAFRRVVTDCSCFAGLARAGLESGAFSVSSNDINGAALMITNGILENYKVPEACINDQGLSEHLTKAANMRIGTPRSATDVVLTDPDGYRACVVAEGLARFRANPTSIDFEKAVMVASLLACNAP